jgi:hypothetical protein
MVLRSDLPYLTISVTSFQFFDHGQEIKERIPRAWNLFPGDRIFWECAQFDGMAEVRKCEVVNKEKICTLVKVI